MWPKSCGYKHATARGSGACSTRKGFKVRCLEIASETIFGQKYPVIVAVGKEIVATRPCTLQGSGSHADCVCKGTLASYIWKVSASMLPQQIFC